jgi:hypothetical protein
MLAEHVSLVETGIAALLFALTFLFGGKVHPLKAITRDRRSLVSFSAGMSAAYVFVHLMPEMHGARSVFAESVSGHLPLEGMVIYFVALVGFLAFYGLEHLRVQLSEREGSEGEGQGKGTLEGAEAEEGGLAYRLHVGGFAAYVALVGYLLVRNLEETPVSTALFATAMVFHFLTIDHSLREEHGAAYEGSGRWLLACMSLLGWGAGALFALPAYVLALLVAFLSGAIIMNSAVMELPGHKDGRFLPFVLGGLIYGLILLPLG